MRRASLLIGAGLAGEVVYLAFVLRLSWSRYGASLTSWRAILGAGPGPLVACLAAVGLLFVLYAAGWLALRGGEDLPRLRRVVWVGAIVFALTVFWLLPMTSDLFTYLSQAHLFTDVGANPFVAPALGPGSPAPDDPLLRAYPALYSFRPSVYGPGWLLLSLPATAVSDSVVWGIGYLKGLAALAFLVCAWLLQRILAEGQARGLRPADGGAGSWPVQAVYLFAWNPLIVLLGVGDGHNDLLMMAVVLLAVWLLLRDRWLPAVALLALSAWIKFVSAPLLLLFAAYAWQRGRLHKWLVAGIGGLAGASLLVLLPFGRPDWLPGLAGRLLQPVNAAAVGGALQRGLALSAAVAFVVVCVALACWLARRRPVAEGAGSRPDGGLLQRALDAAFMLLLLAFVLGAARTQPWHLLWPAALAGLAGLKLRLGRRCWHWPWPAIAALSAALLAGQYWVEWGLPAL